MRGRRRKTVLLLATALAASAIGVLTYATHFLRRTELQTIDARFSIRSDRHRPAGIVLVNIDNASLDNVPRLGQRLPYPFPRRDDATVIDHLRAAGAKVIAMDMAFEHETDPAD